MHSVHSGSVAVGGPQTNSSSLQGGLLSAKATPEPNTYRSNLRNRGSYELGPIRLTTYTRAYVYQRLGVAFMFIPINTLAYLDVPPGKNNQISSMINMFRHLGASVGLSMVQTLTQRRAQMHQDTFSMHTSTHHPALRDHLSGLTNNLFHA